MGEAAAGFSYLFSSSSFAFRPRFRQSNSALFLRRPLVEGALVFPRCCGRCIQYHRRRHLARHNSPKGEGDLQRCCAVHHGDLVASPTGVAQVEGASAAEAATFAAQARDCGVEGNSQARQCDGRSSGIGRGRPSFRALGHPENTGSACRR